MYIAVRLCTRSSRSISACRRPKFCLSVSGDNGNMSNQDDLPGSRQWLSRWLWRQRRTRLAVSAGIGAVAAALTAVFGSWPFAPAVGWDATAVVFPATVWHGIWPLSAHTTAKRATREPPSTPTHDTLPLAPRVVSPAA